MNATAAAFAREGTLQMGRLEGRTLRQIQEWLGSYARLAEAREAAMLDPNGAVLVRWESPEHRADLDALGVLASAAVCAMRTLAGQLGDSDFGGICHRGQHHCLYLAPLEAGYLLLTLQGPDVSVDEIRESLVRIVPRLNQHLLQETKDPGRGSACKF